MQIAVLLLALIMSGCAKQTTEQVANQSGFSRQYIQTDKFALLSYQKVTQPKQPLNIYIEGDGRAWISRTRLSSDPSPRGGLVMSLAALDPSANVIYLARPCQYSPDDLKTVCEKKYWSEARYANEIIQSMDQAVTKIKNRAQAEKINLIGYSGGAAIAILLAANRNDIASIRTIAGNLDLTAMQEHHNTTPLSDSLDPIKFASKINSIPQVHFNGKKDSVVPVIVAENFRKAANLPAKNVITLDNNSHNRGWVEAWPKLLNISYHGVY